MRVSVAAILGAFALLWLAPVAIAADDDKDGAKPPAEKSDSAKPSDEKSDSAKPSDETTLPKGATEVTDDDDKAKGKDEKPDDTKAEKDDDKAKKPDVSAGGDKEDKASGNATGDSKSGASLKDLVNDGFVIRTTVFIPAEAVTRQLGKVSGDAVVITLQKQFSTAICYYSFKAYVGAGLTKIGSCTVHQ